MMLVAMLVVGASLGWQNGLGRIDQTVYDAMVTASGRAARDDIIIIAIIIVAREARLPVVALAVVVVNIIKILKKTRTIKLLKKNLT